MPPTGQTSWSRKSTPTRSSLSPFYKPSHEDLRVQAVYDTALVFTKGAQELHDTLKTLEAMAARPTTPSNSRSCFSFSKTSGS